jgi:hypothetical protein
MSAAHSAMKLKRGGTARNPGKLREPIEAKLGAVKSEILRQQVPEGTKSRNRQNIGLICIL